ncbi:MAG: hypothetical protein JXR48_17615 [Candidatus Delongbacteria bacterium]|nr:hypothetical protein [Candidatus Delongbacteria bacterium]MBN2836776.1 hypothetical protein [Candidatus Delongbacteria bacterium]
MKTTLEFGFETVRLIKIETENEETIKSANSPIKINSINLSESASINKLSQFLDNFLSESDVDIISVRLNDALFSIFELPFDTVDEIFVSYEIKNRVHSNLSNYRYTYKLINGKTVIVYMRTETIETILKILKTLNSKSVEPSFLQCYFNGYFFEPKSTPEYEEVNPFEKLNKKEGSSFIKIFTYVAFILIIIFLGYRYYPVLPFLNQTITEKSNTSNNTLDTLVTKNLNTDSTLSTSNHDLSSSDSILIETKVDVPKPVVEEKLPFEEHLKNYSNYESIIIFSDFITLYGDIKSTDLPEGALVSKNYCSYSFTFNKYRKIDDFNYSEQFVEIESDELSSIVNQFLKEKPVFESFIIIKRKSKYYVQLTFD